MAHIQKATFAAGCFWGVEHIFKKNFDVITRVGYIGGKTDKPSYKQVCSGNTGHAEAVQIEYDSTKISYETLVEFFYKTHDPTTANSQGPDVGSQYRSAIFYYDDEQKNVAKDVTQRLQEKLNAAKEKADKEAKKIINPLKYSGFKIVTEIVEAGRFFDAESYHQQYLDKNPGGYECPTHFVRW
nr:8605_t:CDS:2 [Entrophospora candida]CAG8455426.1 1977_t:CDS:2 [Entrophospora candida]